MHAALALELLSIIHYMSIQAHVSVTATAAVVVAVAAAVTVALRCRVQHCMGQYRLVYMSGIVLQSASWLQQLLYLWEVGNFSRLWQRLAVSCS